MPHRHDLAALRQLLTSNIDLMTQAPLTSEHLKRLVPAFSLSLIRVDERCAPTQHYSEFFDDASHQLFAAAGHHFSAASDDPAAFGNLLRNAKPFGTLIHTPEAYLAGGTYQHLFKRNGIHHVLDVALRDACGPLGILGLFREEDAPPFTRSDLVPIAELYPFLVHAFARTPMESDHDLCDSAMIVAATDGKIEWASPHARLWLSDASDNRERHLLADKDLLPTACRELARQLGTCLDTTRATADSPQAPTMTLPVPGGRLRLRAYYLDVHAGAGARRVGIHLSLEVHRGLRVLRALEQSELTPHLRRVAFLLWQGGPDAEICASLEITPSSLKTYRREIYARLDVSSLEQLRRKLQAMAEQVNVDLTRHVPDAAAPQPPALT